MPIELKDGFKASKYVRRAAERRAADEAFQEFTQADIDTRAKSILGLRRQSVPMPPLLPGSVLDARVWSEYIRNQKMSMGIVSSQGTALELEIKQSAQKNFAVLDDLQREAQALDAYVTEEEVKINGRYSRVHFNSFVRQEDAPLAYNNPAWLQDYKTSLPFQPDNMSDMLAGTGLTLPLRERVAVPIVNAVLVGEETDVGDTRWPIVSTDAKNLLRRDCAFRHVIIRNDHDKTSRKYNHTPSYCTILLTLANIQLVNELTIRPLGHSTVYVDNISYLNEAGEEVQLTEVELPSEVQLTVLFEPIRTRYLKVRLRQYAPVTRTQHVTGDLRVREINKLLRGAGFSQLLNETGESVQGRVFDFSLESMSVGLRVYENLGVFRSQPIEVVGPIGVSYSDIVETIQISNENRTYGTTFFLDEGEVLLERYIGVDLHWPEGSKAFRDLIPVPDERTSQREFLPILSGESRAKLFPDFMWNLDKLPITDISWILGAAGVSFASPHEFDREVGVLQTDRLWIISGPGSGAQQYNFSTVVWYQLDDNSILCLPEDISGLVSGSLELNKIVPYAFIESGQADPLTVYREDTALSIGSDYEISIDSGSTWLTKFPRDKRWLSLKSKAKAGTFKIRFTMPRHNDLYWVDYRVLRNQQLSRRPGVRLRNGRVVFDKRFQEASGTLSTVIVSRADNVNAYLTPVILSYFLRVREHVS